MRRLPYCLAALSLFLGLTGPARADYKFAARDVPGALVTSLAGSNAAGQVVGWYVDDDGFHGFLLSEGRYIPFDLPGAAATRPAGINAGGLVVGSYYDGHSDRGFVATPKR